MQNRQKRIVVVKLEYKTKNLNDLFYTETNHRTIEF